MRRSRAHKRGDHSLCVRCVVLRADPDVVAAAEPVTDATRGLQVLAGQLTAAYGTDPMNAPPARELRVTLQGVMARPGTGVGGLAGFCRGLGGAWGGDAC